MAENVIYNLGDIVRWKDSKIAAEYDYGMLIKDPEIVSGGTYKFVDEIVEVFDIRDSSFISSEPMVALTVFSFAEQKVITLYRNPEDIPRHIEKVKFS